MNPIVQVIDQVYVFVVRTSQYGVNLIFGYDDRAAIVDVTQVSPGFDISLSALEEVPLSFKRVGTLLSEREGVTSPQHLRGHAVMYVGSADAPLYLRPVREFDEVILRVPYGSMILVISDEGRFVKVSYENHLGYMLRDDVVDRASFVYPEFVSGEENHFDDPNTLRVRACIRDQFAGGETEYSLQAGEYVVYRLFRKGVIIPWNEIRPRVPGRWHELFQGGSGTTVDTTPKVGAILECILPEDVGHVAYVEAVYPDESITISEANYPDRGVYGERTLSKEEWQQLNAHFIHIDTKHST